MSELREAAQAALTAYETFRDVDDIDGLDDAIDRLRAALARPPAAPDAEVRNQHKEFARWFLELSDKSALTSEDLAWLAWKAALAHPPRDGWRPASEPPDNDRDVQAWIEIDLSELDEVVTEQCDAQAFYEEGTWHVRGPDHDGWMQLCPGHTVSVVAWRDVTPPTEGK